MRFSNLKKRFPSLRVSVLVIAAFALLGSMMIPSIGEKMGLSGSSCLAGSGYYYEDETDVIAILMEEDTEEDPFTFTEMLDCLDDCDSRLERVLSVFDAYCGDNETCYEVFEDSAERLYLEKANECVERYEE